MYTIVETKFHAWEVWQDGVRVSRHPNRAEAINAVKRFKKADKRNRKRI